MILAGRLRTLLVVGLAVAVDRPEPAPAQLLGPEFQVNSSSLDLAAFPGVAADELGDFVVVWNRRLQGDFDVVGRRFDSNGTPLGGEFLVNSYTPNHQTGAAVARDASGAFVVVWDSFYEDGSGWGIFGRRFDANGAPFGNGFKINTYTTYHQYVPKVAALSSGRFLVSWRGYWQSGANEISVYAQCFDSDGSELGAEFQVNTYTSGAQVVGEVVPVGADRFVVVWGGPQSSFDDVFGRRIDATCLPEGNEFQINTYTTYDQQAARAAADGSGRMISVWQSWSQDGSPRGVFGQRFDSSGSPLGGEFLVNTFTEGDQSFPAVAADASGNILVVWREWSSQTGSGKSEVYAQRFSPEGARVGPAFRVNSFTPGYQELADVATGAPGTFIVVWSSGSSPTYTVAGRRVVFPYFYGGFEAGDFSAWSFICNSGDICP